MERGEMTAAILEVVTERIKLTERVLRAIPTHPSRKWFLDVLNELVIIRKLVGP